MRRIIIAIINMLCRSKKECQREIEFLGYEAFTQLTAEPVRVVAIPGTELQRRTIACREKPCFM